jgi:hypothetical protein
MLPPAGDHIDPDLRRHGVWSANAKVLTDNQPHYDPQMASVAVAFCAGAPAVGPEVDTKKVGV